jgi:hypothetical protein
VRPGAVIGGGGAVAIGDRQGEAIAAAWRGGVARSRGRSWSLPVATVVPGLEVRRAEEKGTGRVEHFTEAELATRDDRDRWELGPRIGVGPLELDGRRAAELGLTAHVVDDAAGLRQAYGLEGAIAIAEPGWADRLLEALASPSLAWLLLLIGGAGLFIELKTPGADKGQALAAFMAEPPFAGATPIMVGDDLTDEAGFRAAVALGGYGVLVGPKRESAARHRLEDVNAVLTWLEAVAGA